MRTEITFPESIVTEKEMEFDQWEEITINLDKDIEMIRDNDYNPIGYKTNDSSHWWINKKGMNREE